MFGTLSVLHCMVINVPLTTLAAEEQATYSLPACF